jgi:hypothetical protein
MVTLNQSNPYLRDPVKRLEMLQANARQSSIFEGARLPPFARQVPSARRASMALVKKSAKAS